MKIRVNEIEREVSDTATLAEVRHTFKPEADVIIVNGFPCPAETALSPGDDVVLIRRGEVPSEEDLEALMVARHTPGVHATVRGARVGIAGLGGLGSQIAIALARVGVGRLTLADFDVVEPSNLNRQQYFIHQLGLPKVEALSETLRTVNPYVHLDLCNMRISPDNVVDTFAGCEVLVEAFDRAEEKTKLVETALSRLHDTTVVAASGVAGHGATSTLEIHRINARLFVVGDRVSEARPFMGLMAPRVGVAAHMQANLVLRLLLGEES